MGSSVVAHRAAKPTVRGSIPGAGGPAQVDSALNEYRSMTGNLTAAEKGTGHPTLLCRWPSIMGVATCPSATLNLSMPPRFRFFFSVTQIFVKSSAVSC